MGSGVSRLMSQANQTQFPDGKIPKIYETDDIPFEEKIIHQVWRIASVGFVWCIAEIAENGREAFGYANLNCDRDAEWGYIDLEDIFKNGANLVATPVMPFAEVIKAIRPEEGECPECGSDQYGYQSIRRRDPTLSGETFHLWICGNCNYQPFTNIRG